MDISPELQALFDKGKELEAQLAHCVKCGGSRKFLGSVPGVECRVCGTRWHYLMPSGKEIEVEQVPFDLDGGLKGFVWVPKKNWT